MLKVLYVYKCNNIYIFQCINLQISCITNYDYNKISFALELLHYLSTLDDDPSVKIYIAYG